jgi:TRAP-type C4-dicarboxylate transport system permease small subunit
VTNTWGEATMSESRNSLFQLINQLSQISGYIAALSILAATLIIVEQVVVRYVFKIPTIWQVETAVYLLIAATFLGAPYGLKENAHINIDLFIVNFSADTRRKLDIATSAIAMLFCFLLAYRGGVMWWEAFEGNWRSSSLFSVPLVYPYALIPVGMFLTGLQYIVKVAGMLSPRNRTGPPSAQTAGR